MRKTLLVALALLLGMGLAAMAAVATGPATWRVERTSVVAAAPALLHSALSEPQRWIAWSPGEARDPRISRTYGGPASGIGATYYWSGNASVGKGRMTVVGAAAGLVEVEVETERPSRSTEDLEIRLAPEGTGTRVTWTATGENGPLDKLLRFFGDRRGGVATEVDARLEKLGAAAEAQARIPVHRLERSTFVAVPPEAVRNRIVDLRTWSGWSPWKGPLATTANYGGPPTGVGSTVYWQVGEAEGRGRVTIVAASPERIELEMEAGAPHALANDLEFRIAPEGTGARVTWSMTGDGGLEAADLERSLARLKALSESRVGSSRPVR